MKNSAIIIGAGIVSTAIGLLIEWRIKTAVTSVAKAEAKKEIAKITKASLRGSTIAVKKDNPIVVLPQPKTETGYFYTL